MLTLPTMIHASKEEPLLWLDKTAVVDGRCWLVGSGPLPAPVLVVGDYVREDDIALDTPFPGLAGKDLKQRLHKAGIDIADCRLTYAVRFNTRGKQPKQSDIGLCIPILTEEIVRCQPKLILCLGACAVKAVLGHSAVFTHYRGSITPHPKLQDTNVFVTYNPAAIGTRPEIVPECEADWNALARFIRPELREDNNVKFYVLDTADAVECVCEELSDHAKYPILVLDCEWEGSHHMDPDGYLRTLQLGFGDNEVVIVALSLISDADRPLAMSALKQLLEDKGTQLCGHHLRADGKWLLSRGIDIRDTTAYDTMVAEHTVNSTGPFGLTDMTLRYTGMGKYDQDLVQWKGENPDLCRKGYGSVPAKILYPYAAADVEAPRRIMKKQTENLPFFTKPRGQYPSLWDVDLDASKTLYELENTGLLVDKGRLSELTQVYQACRNELEARVVQLAASAGVPDYNFRSVYATRTLLFDCLGLTPINDTDNTPWDRVIMESGDELEDVSPSTDKTTLAILADAPGTHPVVGALRDLRRVDYVCSLWLAEPEIAAKYDYESSGGGLLARMWPDGRLHANFSQLKETARFGSSRPNVQNWLKRAEGELRRIVTPKFIDPVFGTGAALPSLRSIIIPTPGYVLIEADWKQAEMFVLAALSGDDAMWSALTTPGLDLHDNTAISAFGIKIMDANGNLVPESRLLEMALADFNKYGTTEKHEFEAFQNTLIYLDQRGKSLTRKAFRDTLRVSAKSLNFGCNTILTRLYYW